MAECRTLREKKGPRNAVGHRLLVTNTARPTDRVSPMLPCRLMRILLQSLLLSLSLSMIRAQAPADPPPAPPIQPAPVVVPAPAAPAIAKERTVYIPFDDLAKTLANEGQGVFLPYREFLEMWNQLTLQQKQEQIQAPADAVLSSMEYTGTVAGEVASITATLQVESFKEKGWAVLPLVGKNLNLAKADTGTATLRLAGENGYELLLPQKGKYTIKLELMARVERTSGHFQLNLTLPKAPVSRCTLTIPEEGWEFRLQPVAAYTAKSNGQGATELSFFFSEAESISAQWQKQGGETKLTPLVFAEMVQSVNAGAGTVQNTLEIDYRILRAGVEKFTLIIPAPHEVLQVSGENIKEWLPPKADGPNAQELTILLHSPAREHFHLRIQLEAPVDALQADVKIPSIEARDIVRQRGSVLLYAPTELDATLKDLSGLNQQEIAVAPAAQQVAPANGSAAIAPQGPAAVQASYRYLKLPFAATLSLKRAEPLIEVTTATLVQTALDAVRFTTSVQANVKRSGIFNLRLQVPMDFENIEATGPVVDVSKLEEMDGKRFLEVRFKSRVTGPVVFTVKGRHNRESAEQPILLPVFDPQNVARHEAIVALSLHESLDANTKELGGLRQEDVANVIKQLPEEPVVPESHLGAPSLAFRYRGTAAPGTITTRLKQSQVIGDVQTFIELKEQAARYAWHINYDIQYAGVDSFTLQVPVAIAKDLRVDTRDLKEVVKTPAAEGPPAADFEIWKVTLRDKRMGSFGLDLSLEVPIKDLTAAQATEVSVPQLVLQEVFQEIGQTAITKDGNLEVLDSKPENLENIDPKELRGTLSRPGIILSYKNLGHPSSLKLSLSKNIFLEVPQAIVTYAVLNTVVSRDGATSTEAIYWVKNNTLQYLDVELPKGGRMLSDVYVNGEPQQPMQRAMKADETRSTDNVLIKIPSGQNGNAFPVRFLYEIPAAADTAGKDLGYSGSLTIPPPVLHTTVLQSQLTLYLPRDYVYLDFEGTMRPSPKASGWSDPQRRLRWLIPALGPDINPASTQGWNPPPPLPAESKGGFNLSLSADGQAFPLHRLDAPSSTTITYRSAKLDAAVRYTAMIATFLIGLLLLRKTIELKSTYFCIVGLGSLVLRGLMIPAWTPLWESVWIGTLLAVFVWLVVGVPRMLASMFSGSKKSTPPSLPPEAGPPPSAPPTPERPPFNPGPSHTDSTAIPVETSQILFRERPLPSTAPGSFPPIPDPSAAPLPPLETPPPVPPEEPMPPFPSDSKSD